MRSRLKRGEVMCWWLIIENDDLSATSWLPLGYLLATSRPPLGHLSATSRPPLGHLSATSRPRAGRRVGQSCRILAVLGLISSGLVTFSHGPAAGARREAAGQARHEVVGADAARLDGVHGLARLGGVQAVTGEFARFGRVVGSPRWTFERPFAGAEGASHPKPRCGVQKAPQEGPRRV